MKKSIIYGMLIVLMASCSTQHIYAPGGQSKNIKTVSTGSSSAAATSVLNEQTQSRVPIKKTGGFENVNTVNMQPNATAFRMSGDYYDNVAITLGPDGNLLYFPAPTDITADSAPLDLGNGWWLNRQGISPNSQFTKYTFAEYSSLADVPSPQQLKNAIIPGAKVTEFVELPMKFNEASQNLDAVREYLKGY